MVTAIDNIGVACSQLERSIAFYLVLGFQDEGRTEEGGLRGCVMGAGSAHLFLFQTKAEGSAPARDFSMKQNPVGLDHISFWVGDVDQAYEAARSRGLVFDHEPTNQSWGRRTACLKDPDGNNIWLLGEPKG